LAPYALCCLLSATFSGCGEKSAEPKTATAAEAKAPDDKPTEANPGPPATPPTTKKLNKGQIADTATAATANTKPGAVPEVDNSPRTPATVEEARRVLDLTKFPLPAGAQVVSRTIAHVQYRVLGELKPVFEYARQELEKQGWKWKVTPRTRIDETTAYGTFARDGFHVSVRLFPHGTDQEPNGRGVSITNWGNVDLTRLPIPPEVKLTHSYPNDVWYVTNKPPAETAAAIRELLMAQGWEHYGTFGVKIMYKQNAVMLSATVSARDGITQIEFDVMQMSADLPAPPEPLRTIYFEYDATPKRLSFESAADPKELYQFYRDKLAQAGWKPTTDNPITDDSDAFMIFRNPARDMITLKTRHYPPGRIGGTLQHQSADELAEIERMIELDRPRLEKELAETRKQEEAENRKKEALAEKKRQEDEKRRVKVAIVVPADAKAMEFEPDRIEFQVPRGKARAAADAIRKRIRDAGWKEKTIVEEAVTGSYTFENNEFDDQRISLTYIDPGVIPAEVTVSGSGVELEKAAVGKK
jgi:hypothetical protein